jgi:hypothetical protein
MSDERGLAYWDRKYKLWRILHPNMFEPENKCMICYNKIHMDLVNARRSLLLQLSYRHCPWNDRSRLIIMFEPVWFNPEPGNPRLRKSKFYLDCRIFEGTEDCMQWIMYV